MSKKDGISDETKAVVLRNSDMVYRLAFSQMKNKDDADDVYQEVFCRYIKKNPCFNSDEHEKAWFIRVTLNCSKTVMKSFWKTKVVELDDCAEITQVEKDDLSFALAQLPKRYNAVIHLFYYEDLSTSDISKILKISESNVRMLLTRARRELKKILKGSQYSEK
ncbi:MAG: sigma-70 family RNA polymerase sigma factor [Clostridia bacterium]|nr:sigma-70 family RNA polymerase sigma factor [Clostridia bacterium]